MNLQYMTDFLTPQNSFFIGIGSVLNIGGDYFKYNRSSTSEDADKKAICMDWKITGNDILNSMNEIDNEIKEKKRING